MTADTPPRSPLQELLQPLQTIMDLVGAETAEQAVEAVRRTLADCATMDFLLSNLSVASVVMAGDRPLFVQLPPNALPEQYAPEQLQMVRDALVEASVSLRIPQTRSQGAQEAKSDDGC